MPCAISTRPLRSIGGSASPSGRAIVHPWGTQNHIVQLPGFFLELLSVVEPEKLGNDGFSEYFGRFNQRFLTRQEGLSFLMLESEHVAADAAEIHAAGFTATDVLTFERDAAGPDGTRTRVGFSLAFARDPLAPEIGFAVSQVIISREVLESRTSAACQ